MYRAGYSGMLSLMLLLLMAVPADAEFIGNPGTQVGEKNLFVGIEYSSMRRVIDMDTDDLETDHRLAALKVTTGLTDWLDIFLKGGGASVTLNYRDNDYSYKNLGYAAENYESDYEPGFGGGARIRLLNFVDSRTRVFFHGSAFISKTDDSITWNNADGSVFSKERDLTWVDFYTALGATKRTDLLDITVGVGFSDVWWEIEDVDVAKSGSSSGTTESRIPLKSRDSFEVTTPVFGFAGLDFILPYAYRLSVHAAVRNMDEYEFGVALSQGLDSP